MIQNVRRADRASLEYMRAIDGSSRSAESMPRPSPENTDDGTPQRKPELAEIPFLDLNAEGITSIVWATGFRCNFDWIDLPVLDPRGYPHPGSWGQPLSRPLFLRPPLDVLPEIRACFSASAKRLRMSQVICLAEIDPSPPRNC